MVRTAAAYDATPHLKIDPRLPEAPEAPLPVPEAAPSRERPRGGARQPLALGKGGREAWTKAPPAATAPEIDPRLPRGRRSSSDTYLVQRYAGKQADNYKSGTRGRA